MKYIRKYTLESDWEDDQQDREANVPVTSWLVDVDEVRYDHEEEPEPPEPVVTLVLTSESNPEVFTILDEAGFDHEDPDGYTAAELGEITDGDFYSITRDSTGNATYYSIFFNSDIETFDEFQYFTGITGIKHLAFTSCNNLSSIILPNTITTIYGSSGEEFEIGYNGIASPFKGTNLSSIVIPNSVISIGDFAFNSCYGLVSITIPNSVATIGVCAFYMCNRLTSLIIGNSVTSIDNRAFDTCDNLAGITSLATTAPTIEYNTFLNLYRGGTLHVPSGSDYSTWMQNTNYYLGKSNWTIAYDA